MIKVNLRQLERIRSWIALYIWRSGKDPNNTPGVIPKPKPIFPYPLSERGKKRYLGKAVLA